MMGDTGAHASDAAGGKEEEIEDMLSHLELNEDELDDVVIGSEDAKEYKKEARWLAIGKVLTPRSFSSEALFEKMKSIWNLSRDPICREAGENLFIFQMHCLGDWKKVVHQGPWTFRGWGLLVEDYDGLSDPEEFVFRGMHVWAQIHGIPELYRKKEVIDDLARRIGAVKEVQMTPKLYFEGNYVRLRVKVDTTKPLMRFVSLTIPDEGRKRLAVKYEKVPFFCKRCGLFGHDHEECGDGVWDDKQLQYGTWMLAVRRSTQPAQAPRRFTPKVPARGGFSGGGGLRANVPRKRSSGDAGLDKDDDLQNTAESPLKNGLPIVPFEKESEKGARKKLELQPGDPENNGGAIASLMSSDTDGTMEVPPPPPPYIKNKDRSKVRKKDESEIPSASSAASSEEDRRAQ
jgi:sporulation protein YlmC with PRC-barrel domain